ncbi:hypothetical protein RF55_1438 [Lasius niger]|uniref:Uncharacterized protein n=1 Tax=Lasius niger TaxID=67767 RepID=A0A0J7P0P0_LASNI|nr:hypothetical protein RF55_1438 [Lasius niger]
MRIKSITVDISISSVDIIDEFYKTDDKTLRTLQLYNEVLRVDFLWFTFGLCLLGENTENCTHAFVWYKEQKKAGDEHEEEKEEEKEEERKKKKKTKGRRRREARQRSLEGSFRNDRARGFGSIQSEAVIRVGRILKSREEVDSDLLSTIVDRPRQDSS